MSGSSTRLPGEPVPASSVRVIQIRGPQTLRGICRRSREDLFTVDGYYPPPATSAGSTTTGSCSTTADPTTCSRSAGPVYPSEVESALREIDGVRSAFVTEVNGTVGAAVVGIVDREAPRAEAHPAQRIQGSDGVAVARLVDDVPRGATGKVDVRRLREMLAGDDERRSS